VIGIAESFAIVAVIFLQNQAVPLVGKNDAKSLKDFYLFQIIIAMARWYFVLGY